MRCYIAHQTGGLREHVRKSGCHGRRPWYSHKKDDSLLLENTLSMMFFCCDVVKQGILLNTKVLASEKSKVSRFYQSEQMVMKEKIKEKDV